MCFTDSGIVKESIPLQSEKADPQIISTELGIVTEVKPLKRNACSPMIVTELGIVTEVKPLQP